MLSAQKVFRWTMRGPFSSYSSLEIHMEGIVGSDPRMDPPSHAACLRSGRASTCAQWVAGWAPSVAGWAPRVAGWASRVAGWARRVLALRQGEHLGFGM